MSLSIKSKLYLLKSEMKNFSLSLSVLETQKTKIPIFFQQFKNNLVPLKHITGIPTFYFCLQDGRLEGGDQILSVNESSLIDVTQTQ